MRNTEFRFEGEPAAGGPWIVSEATLTEGLNCPYSLELRLTTEAEDALPIELLGKPAKLTILHGTSSRQVTGIVAEVTERSVHAELLTGAVEVVVRPALEALRHRIDTRIFQDKTVPEILEEILGDGLGAYERSVDNRLNRTYPSCEYRVQYDESDLAFCQRLMEEEGIRYWFEHEGEAETLVLADTDDAYGTIETADGESTIELIPAHGGNVPTGEHIRTLHVRSTLAPTMRVLRHFDWTRPSTPIEGESADEGGGDLPSGSAVGPAREIYEHGSAPLTLSDYDGTAYGASDVDEQARLRREAAAVPARVAEGASTVSAMRPGATFEVRGHPAPEHDGGYLVVSAVHTFSIDAETARNTFRCIPRDVPYRAPRETPRPRIGSLQTAIVVGPAGEEIHTDEHGRIKVQLPWDRLGAMDDKSSCWMRVMQPWAGAGWGILFLPRMGMEVVVRFVDGDPDRPLVIGSLYNAEHPVPYALPDEKTKSTIKTESSLGGGGSNELRFDDFAGSEEVFTHAQKDQNEVVENDHTTTVHHDQHIRVDHDQTQEIGNDQTEHVFANQDLTVDANRTITVHGDFTETIDGSETRTVSAGSTETIDAGETRTVTGGMTESITGDRSQTIDGSSTETITASLTQTVLGGVAIETPATYEVTAAGGITITAVGGITIVAPAGHTIVAPGGQTIIDSAWQKTGQAWYDCRALSVSAQFFKLSTKAVLIGASGLKFEWSTIKLAKSGVKLFSHGGLCQKMLIKRRAVGIVNKVAGAHVDGAGG